jgi:hypothetical protein
MNSNLIHNILNVLIAVSAGVTALFLATGCTTLASGALECSQSWINPSIAAIAITAMGVLKVVINVVRDGFGGLVKPQPPVDDTTK